jgi:hypothetical protein
MSLLCLLLTITIILTSHIIITNRQRGREQGMRTIVYTMQPRHVGSTRTTLAAAALSPCQLYAVSHTAWHCRKHCAALELPSALTCARAAHHANLPARLHLKAQATQHQRQPRPVPGTQKGMGSSEAGAPCEQRPCNNDLGSRSIANHSMVSEVLQTMQQESDQRSAASTAAGTPQVHIRELNAALSCIEVRGCKRRCGTVCSSSHWQQRLPQA